MSRSVPLFLRDQAPCGHNGLAGLLQLSQLALLILYLFSSIRSTIFWWQHLGDFVHHLLGGFVDIFAGDLLALWLQDHWLAIGDSYRSTELFERLLTAPNGYRYHGNAGTQGYQAQA
jgi:hypothetical protein